MVAVNEQMSRVKYHKAWVFLDVVKSLRGCVQLWVDLELLGVVLCYGGGRWHWRDSMGDVAGRLGWVGDDQLNWISTHSQ